MHYFQTRIRLNEGYVNGNTAGNLYNSGLFCENGGTVFFSNPDDNGRLYSMNPDGSNLKKLCDDSAVSINADAHYVYYIRNYSNESSDFSYFVRGTRGLCRIPRSGGTAAVLDDGTCFYASLIGNYIYYLHYEEATASTLYKIKIDGSGQQKLLDQMIFPCSTLGQYFYYNSTTDGSLCCYDTATDTSSAAYECNCYKPIVTGDSNAYYLDVDQDNALVHTSMEFKNPTTITTDSIDLYNVYGSTIYYQRYDKDDSALCRIKNDGGEFQIIAKGNYSDINVTSYYVYFTNYETKEMFYFPVSNPGEVHAFHPGKA